MANKWVTKIASCINGKGGGKADTAQASGCKETGVEQLISIGEQFASLSIS